MFIFKNYGRLCYFENSSTLIIIIASIMKAINYEEKQLAITWLEEAYFINFTLLKLQIAKEHLGSQYCWFITPTAIHFEQVLLIDADF